MTHSVSRGPSPPLDRLCQWQSSRAGPCRFLRCLDLISPWPPTDAGRSAFRTLFFIRPNVDLGGEGGNSVLCRVGIGSSNWRCASRRYLEWKTPLPLRGPYPRLGTTKEKVKCRPTRNFFLFFSGNPAKCLTERRRPSSFFFFAK